MRCSDVRFEPDLLSTIQKKDITASEQQYDSAPEISSDSLLLPHFPCLSHPKVIPVLQVKPVPVPDPMK